MRVNRRVLQKVHQQNYKVSLLWCKPSFEIHAVFLFDTLSPVPTKPLKSLHILISLGTELATAPNRDPQAWQSLMVIHRE